MNLLHMKYAMAVAETKSINKAAEELLVGAPALSRAIKELESSLGVTLFERSAKGMFLTPDGEIFISYAKKALKQIDDIEAVFKNGTAKRKRFSVAAPRAAYISSAFAEFTKKLDPSTEAELIYNETNAYNAINSIIKDEYRLGIIRYRDKNDKHFKVLLDDKNMTCDLLAEFRSVILVSEKSPLASSDEITAKDLHGYAEVVYPDPYIPSQSASEARVAKGLVGSGSRIYVFDHGSALELLSENSNTYMWAAPIPQTLYGRYGIVKKSSAEGRVYRDVLVHRSDYSLSALDKMFIEELVKSKHRVFS